MPRLAALLLALLPAPALADAALVLATSDYRALPDLPRGAAPAGAIEGIEALGFEVAASADSDREEAARAIARFMAQAPEADRVIVALSGRFATDGQRTWWLPADSPAPTLFGLPGAVSVESVLEVLARHPSRALLLLGVDPEARGSFDPWLREGLGELDIPQGVTVLGSTPRALAAFMEDELAEPRGDLAAAVAANGAIRAEGYLPEGFRFMPAARPAPAPEPAPRPDAAEAALWRGAQALDTVQAYRDYLRVYPQGIYAGAAREAIAAILAEPDRAARLGEEALRLTRDQRRAVQEDLATLDFDPRGIDGLFGPGTRAAITNWQQEAGYPQTGYLDAEQVARLSEDADAARAAARAEAEAARRADDEWWRRTGGLGTVEGFQGYLARYPEGRHAEEARAGIAAVEAALRASRAEARAWREAQALDSVAGYSAYLEAYPQGARAEEARAARRAAQAAEAESQAQAQARADEEALGLTPLTGRVIEARLRALDLDPGQVDGSFDADTRAALRRFQADRGLPATGYLDQPTLVRLLADTLGRALGD